MRDNNTRKELLLDKKSEVKPIDEKEKLIYHGDPYARANPISKLIFCWICKAMKVSLFQLFI